MARRKESSTPPRKHGRPSGRFSGFFLVRDVRGDNDDNDNTAYMTRRSDTRTNGSAAPVVRRVRVRTSVTVGGQNSGRTASSAERRELKSVLSIYKFRCVVVVITVVVIVVVVVFD